MWKPWRRVHIGALVAAELDPVMTEAVFTEGQIGVDQSRVAFEKRDPSAPWPDESGSVLFCGSMRELHERCPSLSGAGSGWLDMDEPTLDDCVDLVVEIDSGRLVDVELLSSSLGEILRRLDRPASAETFDQLVGEPAQAAVPALRPLIRDLLRPG